MCSVPAVLILVSTAPGQALANAQVRFLHAIPGGPSAQLQIGPTRGTTLEAVGFGQATQYRPAPAGQIQLTLMAGAKTIAETNATLVDGTRYTVVGSRASSPPLRVLRDTGATPRMSRLRIVHAAPEVGTATMKLDGREVARLKKGAVSGPLAREPGTYKLEAADSRGDDTLIETEIDLVAGTSQTAYVIGSAGERTRFVVLQDAASGPSTGPATGLGGLVDEDRPWLLAILVAVLTGGACGLLYARASGRSGRADA